MSVLFAPLIMVTLVLFARRDVTVTGPVIDIELGLEHGGELAVEVMMETWPSALFECWIDTDGVRASEDFPVSGFTDIDCGWCGGLVMIVGPFVVLGGAPITIL